MRPEDMRILLIEDNPDDVELTLRAFKKHNLANHITVARDGEEALDIIFQRGKESPGGAETGSYIAGPEAAKGRWDGGAQTNQGEFGNKGYSCDYFNILKRRK